MNFFIEKLSNDQFYLNTDKLRSLFMFVNWLTCRRWLAITGGNISCMLLKSSSSHTVIRRSVNTSFFVNIFYQLFTIVKNKGLNS